MALFSIPTVVTSSLRICAALGLAPLPALRDAANASAIGAGVLARVVEVIRFAADPKELCFVARSSRVFGDRPCS